MSSTTVINNGRFFVTATDTDGGKTLISCGLMKALADHQLKVAGFKPVSAGCEQTAEGLRNSDALGLQAASNIPLEYQQVNPVALAEPVAPHLAAARIGRQLGIDELSQAYQQLVNSGADIILTEGAGGWRLPLVLEGEKPALFLSALAQQQQMAVILVVPVRLGCLNHARLTAEAIAADGLPLAGWVANIMQPDMPFLAENISALQALLDGPMLGQVPWLDDPATVSEHLDVSALLAR